MKIIHVLYLAMLPVSLELGIEIFRARVLGRTDHHVLSAAIRIIIMVIGAISYQLVPWWVTLSVMFALHWAVFNYVFNKYGIEMHWGYLGKNWLDNLQKNVDPHILLLSKIIILALSITLLSFY